MISTQVIATSIEELRAITRVDLCVYDSDGTVVASTFDGNDIQTTLIRNFVDSPADSQVIGIDHLLKILDEGELEDWVYDDKFTEYALHKTPPELWREQEYEQQSLFLT